MCLAFKRGEKTSGSGANDRVLAKDSRVNNFRLKGTRDWARFSLTCKIPEGPRRLDLGFVFWGSGKVRIAMDSLKFDIVK